MVSKACPCEGGCFAFGGVRGAGPALLATKRPAPRASGTRPFLGLDDHAQRSCVYSDPTAAHIRPALCTTARNEAVQAREYMMDFTLGTRITDTCLRFVYRDAVKSCTVSADTTFGDVAAKPREMSNSGRRKPVAINAIVGSLAASYGTS